MNKIVASLGMVALGVSGLSTASAQDAPPQKFWNVSASLRGFYDDNLSTLPSGVPKSDTFGVEVSPGIGLNWETDTTKISAGYRYSLKYYDDKPVGTTKKYDQNHTFDLMLDHVISERFRIGATDSFVIGQEPDALRAGAFSATQRIPGDNIRNYGTVTFDAQLTHLFGLEVGYANSYFDYAADASDGVIPSNSGLLDRIEHKANVDGRLQLAPNTTGVAGYAYGQVDYTADETIGVGLVSEDRNSRSHYGYVGADHMFNPDLTGSIRGGVQYIDFYNLDNTDVSPYVQGSLKYIYAPESTVSVGFTQSRSPMNLLGDPADPVRDADTSVLFGSVRHRIVPNLFGSVIGTFQNAKFNGGGTGFDGKNEQYYQLGLNVEYRFNPYLSTEIGYNYDKVVSDISSGREYDRNRVYIGLTARY
jgi:hypothetical protein